MLVTMKKSPNVLGVSFGAEICTKDLEEGHADVLRRLVNVIDHSEKFEKPATETSPDAREVIVTIKENGHTNRMVFREDDPPPTIQPLLDFLAEYERVVPNT